MMSFTIFYFDVIRSFIQYSLFPTLKNSVLIRVFNLLISQLNLQDNTINDNFAKLAEALYIADRKAREAVDMRANIEKAMAAKEKEEQEQKLRMIAQKAREERSGIVRGEKRCASGGNGDGSRVLNYILKFVYPIKYIFLSFISWEREWAGGEGRG